MATPIRVGDGPSVLSPTSEAASAIQSINDNNTENNNENVLPTAISQKNNNINTNNNFNFPLSPSSRTSKAPPPLSPNNNTTNNGVIQNSNSNNNANHARGVALTVDTGDEGIVFKKSNSTSDNDFSIDRYGLPQSDNSTLDTLSIERADTDRLEQMMVKFDNVQQDDNQDQQDQTSESSKEGATAETPHSLNRMMQKFDLLQQTTMEQDDDDDDENDDEKSNKPDDASLYRDKKLFEVMSPTSHSEGVEVGARFASNDSQTTSSYTSTEMFADLEQFRSADSHSEMPMQASTVQQRIVSLMNQVSKLELEKEDLQSRNALLHSQLHNKHDQDVQDMYQDMYQNPFAAVATPTKSKGGSASGNNSFAGSAAVPAITTSLSLGHLSAAVGGIPSSASMGAVPAVPSTVDAHNNAETTALHTELTELRVKNQSLEGELKTAKRQNEDLSQALETVREEDQEKQNKLLQIGKELEQSKERESVLREELDECKVRLEGFEMAQKTPQPQSNSSESTESGSGSPKKPSSPSRRRFFGSSTDDGEAAALSKPTQTGDVATALVVSQKQNEALEAFNKELELQNTNLQKKCDALTEKYGLNEPSEGDDKGKQLYSRYLEMKSSLSSLSVVLEEAKDDNSDLRVKVAELEMKLLKQNQSQTQSTNDTADSESVSSASSIITPEQEKALKVLVEKLEVQILGYRDAEERHELVRAELESTVDRLDRETTSLRKQLNETSNLSSATLLANTAELESCYRALASKIADTEWNTELEALKASMDAAAKESTRLLNELEALLKSTREELETERTKSRELGILEEEKKEESAGSSSASLLPSPSSEQRLLDEIASLQKQTKQLKADLEQKSTRMEKSEKRVAAKHEQALQLTKANESLRDGIQKLKVHLSSISEQATKTEATLATTREALDVETQRSERLEVEHEALKAKIDVLQNSVSVHGGSSSDSIELRASLAASEKQITLSEKRIQKLLQAKKELEFKLKSTQDDLETQLHTQKQRNSELGDELSSMESELNGTKLLVAAASLKLTKLEESKSINHAKLQNVLKSTREMSKERIKLHDTLKRTKDALQTEKKNTQGLMTIKIRLEARLESTEKSLDDAKTKYATLQKDSAEASRQFSELEKLLATTQEELYEEETRVEALEQQVDALTIQIQDAEKAKSDLGVSLDSAKQEVFTLTAKTVTLECQLQAEKDYNNDSDERKLLGSLQSSMDDGDFEDDTMKQLEIKNKLESLLSHLQSTQNENAKLKSITQDEHAELKSSLAALQNANDEIAELKSSLAALQEQTKKVEEVKVEEAKVEEKKEETTIGTEISSEKKEESRSLPPIVEERKREAGVFTDSILDTATLSSSYHSNDSSTNAAVRAWEAEMLLGNTKRDLEDALKENKQLSGKVDNLESSVELSQATNAQTLEECETHVAVQKEMAMKIDNLTSQVAALTAEKDRLMQRTASLARRDQIQKASLQTSNNEVATLMETLDGFQKKFETLAEQVEKGEAEKQVQMKEFEEEEAKWITERIQLTEQISKLQKECDEIREKHDALDSKHVQALMNEQSDWQSERVNLNTKIAQLEKKDSLHTLSKESSEAPVVASANNAEVYYPSIRQCATDRSLLNQKAGELEQDIQLLEVTLNDTKQNHLIATAELEVTQYKLTTMEEELAAKKDKLAICEEELKICRSEMQAVVIKSATDRESFASQIRELEEELDATKVVQLELKEYREKLEHATEEHTVTRSVLMANKSELEQTRKKLEEAESKLQDNELTFAKAAVKERDMAKAAEERESEFRLKHNACLQELKSCKKELELMATAKSTELKQAIEKQEELQSKLDSCQEELEACKLVLKEKEKVMKHIATKQVLKSEEDGGEIRKNKQALSLLTDELNEAHIREKELEDRLDFAQKELFKAEKKVESFEKQISEEQYGAGVYKDVISKLNQSNENLMAKNKKLKDETETLKESLSKLKSENETSRVVAGDNKSDSANVSTSTEASEKLEQENLVMKDLLEKSQLSVADAKNMQKKLSSQVLAATKRETKLTREVLALKIKNEELEKRLVEQENELDEFESDFALARNDARRVVEELRSQLKQLEARNKQLEAATGGLTSIEDLKSKLKQLVIKNKRLQNECDSLRARERRLENEREVRGSELPRRCR